jgi:MFS transporter, OFA family, oxalate/formate antiporter
LRLDLPAFIIFQMNALVLPLPVLAGKRWVQLALLVGVFMVISGPQYLWALLVKPLLARHGVPLSELQIVFSLVVVCMTFVTPMAGYLHDRYNPKHIIGLGLLLCGGSWILAARAESLWSLALTYGVAGGLGAGISFIGCTGLVQKSFPDKRGFATGMLMSGYALGPLLTTAPVSRSLGEVGVEATLQNFGVLFLAVSAVLLFGISGKPAQATGWHREAVASGVGARQMLRTPLFWLMFAMMAMIASCGMMITSNIAVIAKEYGIGSEVLLFGLGAVPLALILDRITNGFSRILFGYVSDRIGRENTLGLAFALEALFMSLWFFGLHDPVAFILFSGLVFLAWGEIFSVFPALCTDAFGERNASVNFGFLYASVGIGSILGGPVAAWLREWTGSWTPVFTIIVALDLLTAVTAMTLLKRMRSSFRVASP